MTDTMRDGASLIWRGQDITRLGDLGAALCALETEEDAAEFWNAYVEFLGRPTARLGGSSPEAAAGSNIGYLMGYYGPEERERVYGLFPQATHPVFGHDFGRDGADPTPEEAFTAEKKDRELWDSNKRDRFPIADGTFEPYTHERGRRGAYVRAIVPNIPPRLRPKRGLHLYTILWEAEWAIDPVPPVDPALLRHLRGDLYVLCGTWDLTDLERAVLAGRA